MVESGQRSDERTRREQSAPVFSDGQSATRSVSASSPTGTPIGEPVTATDADTRRHADLQPGRTGRGVVRHQRDDRPDPHEVRRHADRRGDVHGDGRGRRRDRHRQDYGNDRGYRGASQQPAGILGGRERHSERARDARRARIGSPVTATDADQGDTLTYSLGGTDAASFDIVSTSGQIRTRAALDYETKASYTVTVTATDSRTGSAAIHHGHHQRHPSGGGGLTAPGRGRRCVEHGLGADCEALLGARNVLEGNARLNWSEKIHRGLGRASISAERPRA